MKPRVHRPTIARSLIVLFVAVMLTSVGVSPALADDFGSPEEDVSVYDRAEIFTPEEISMIEGRADSAAATGAPVFVYLQAKDRV